MNTFVSGLSYLYHVINIKFLILGVLKKFKFTVNKILNLNFVKLLLIFIKNLNSFLHYITSWNFLMLNLMSCYLQAQL